MYNILICDDDKDIVNALKIYLQNPDYRLFEAFNGVEATELVEKEDIHLILMDIMMPQMDGITAMAKIREKFNMPIILLTAKSEDQDKILGLNIGADDYITKPFNPLEVAARVGSQLRRYTKLGSGTAAKELLTVGGIELDDTTKRQPHPHRVRHIKAAYGISRQSLLAQRDIQQGMGRKRFVSRREHRCGTYQTS